MSAQDSQPFLLQATGNVVEVSSLISEYAASLPAFFAFDWKRVGAMLTSEEVSEGVFKLLAKEFRQQQKRKPRHFVEEVVEESVQVPTLRMFEELKNEVPNWVRSPAQEAAIMKGIGEGCTVMVFQPDCSKKRELGHALFVVKSEEKAALVLCCGERYVWVGHEMWSAVIGTPEFSYFDVQERSPPNLDEISSAENAREPINTPDQIFSNLTKYFAEFCVLDADYD
eukprot:TRINITY_DN2343_c0_g1_i1.p1 TRINITY_DN2343_c0_g1~~TRINITY_DN2343_c0_g1_i1.p1  ORF type:complete len:226 (-),score=59.61 TRINITY_DN2343_c0_g1_i1:43-720(-)